MSHNQRNNDKGTESNINSRSGDDHAPERSIDREALPRHADRSSSAASDRKEARSLTEHSSHAGLSQPSRFIYMDNSSTTRPAPEAALAMQETLESEYGNPSSLHSLGARAEQLLRNSKEAVANLMRATPDEIHFTSGGTESNNWALTGCVRVRGPNSHIVSTTVEHPSVSNTLEHLQKEGYEVTLVPVNEEGAVDPEQVLKEIKPETAVVSVMIVQNEIGTIEPIEQIGRAIASMKGRRPRFHVDATQGFARLPIDVGSMGIDLLTLSAHKIHGPKGVGVLYVRKGFDIPPLIYGGGQEGGLRSGTENMPGIAGIGAACRLWSGDRAEVMMRLTALRRHLVDALRAAIPSAVLHGPEDKVAPYIVHFSFPGYRGESILHALERRGVFVSTGSACSAHKAKPSPVILALGRSEDEALSSIRISMSRYTTEEDVEATVEALVESLEELKSWRSSETKH